MAVPPATHTPRSDAEARRGAYAQARDAAVRHPDIVTLSKSLGMTSEGLAAELDDAEVTLLAAVADQLAEVESLYVSRTRLERMSEAYLSQRRTLGGAESTRTARKSIDKLESNPEWQRIEESIRVGVDRLRSALEQAMVPHLRQCLNELKQQHAARAELYGRTLDQVDTSSLRKEEDSFVLTDQLSDLGRLIARTPAGSIGVAGPRGAGKSTAIKNVERLLPAHADRSPYRIFDVTVSAPVTYVPLEFLMHLHGEICRAWLDHEGFDPSRSAEASSQHRTMLSAGTLLLIVSVLVAAGLAGVLRFLQAGPVGTESRSAPVIMLLSLIALSCWLGSSVVSRVRRLRLDALTERGGTEAIPRKEEYLSGREEGAPATWIPLFVRAMTGWSLMVSVLLVMYGWGLPGFGPRHLIGMILVLLGLLAVPVWMSLGFDRLNEEGLTHVVLGTAAIAALLATGVSGIGLMLPPELFASTLDLAVGSALISAAACLIPLISADKNTRPQVPSARLTSAATAWRDRRRMDFQRTQSHGQAVTVKLGASRLVPLGLDAQRSSSTSEVEAPLSVPLVTRMIRNLLTVISSEKSQEAFKIVIGIDELDKIDDVESARTFLNEIKGIFRVPGTIFLVSISEDAMAGFERRDLSFRTVFDSAFDEVVYLPQLLLSETRTVVHRRINDVPRTFVDLAHCLSAGLARDVIRAVDHMDDADTPQSLGRVTQFVVHRELRGKWQAVVAALRGIPLDPQVTELIKALYRIDRCPDRERWTGDVDDYTHDDRCLLRTDPFMEVYRLRLAEPGESELPQFRMLQRLGGEYLCFTYFCRTVLQFFNGTDGENMDRLVRAEEADRLQHLSLDYLARGRYHLAVNPRLGWEQVANFSLAHGLDSLATFPDSLLGRRAVARPQPVGVDGA